MLESPPVAEVEDGDVSLLVVAEVVPGLLVVPGPVASLAEFSEEFELPELEPELEDVLEAVLAAEAETPALAENSALSESAGSAAQAESVASARYGSERVEERIFEHDDPQLEGSLSRSSRRRSSAHG